jgi:hypothetical protein
MKDLGFESTPLLPSLFRHKTKSLVMCSHVDDLILCGEEENLFGWLERERKDSLFQAGMLFPVHTKILENQCVS